MHYNFSLNLSTNENDPEMYAWIYVTRRDGDEIDGQVNIWESSEYLPRFIDDQSALLWVAACLELVRLRLNKAEIDMVKGPSGEPMLNWKKRKQK